MMALALLEFCRASLSSEIAFVAGGVLPASFDAGGTTFWGVPWPQAEHTNTRIETNCFIPFKGWIACNENCSVSCRLPACASITPLHFLMQKARSKQAESSNFVEFWQALSHQDCTTINVENLASNEACMRRTQK